MEESLVMYLCQKDCSQNVAGMHWGPVLGCFRIYSLTTFGGLVSRCFQTVTERIWFMSYFGVHSWDHILYAYYLMLGVGVISAGSLGV